MSLLQSFSQDSWSIPGPGDVFWARVAQQGMRKKWGILGPKAFAKVTSSCLVDIIAKKKKNAEQEGP